MASSRRDNDRRARIDALRREAQRAERRRTLTIVGVCGLVGLLIVGLTAYSLVSRNNSTVTAISGCGDVVVRAAEGSNVHEAPGTPIDYPDAPPAFGSHWPDPAPFGQSFYTAADRPEVEQLVHNLEHGYTVLWYDQSVADDPDSLAEVESIAQTFQGRQDLSAKFIAAPWTSEDGGAFPDGMHVALTHWSASGSAAAPGQGQGDWRYCDRPNPAAVTDFMESFPYSDALEPNGA